MSLSSMTVQMLRAELKKKGLDTTGLKPALVARLAAAAPAANDAAEMSAAIQANDRDAIRRIMAKRKREQLEGNSSSGASSSSSSATLCPICSEERADVEPLAHAASSGGDISDHCACGACRASMIATNSSCPWCRSEVVWKELFGFLDGFKKRIGGIEGDHQGLANLLGAWMEFEMARSRSDLCAFARDLCADSTLAAHVTRGIRTRAPWLRDSAGLWMRLLGMHADGEISGPGLSSADAARLEAAVECALTVFESNHGGHEDFIAALYSQACAAVLSASFSGSSTATVAALAKRAGLACVRVFEEHYGAAPGAKEVVRGRLNREYAEAAQELVWGSAAEDRVFATFFR